MKKFIIVLCAILLASCEKSEQKQVELLLDWLPNTNHTGLFVALDKGYFKENGVNVKIVNSTEESTSDLVINGVVPMGIYFQDYLSHKLEKGAKVTAIAAIIQNNTSGILANVKELKDLEGLKYGTYNYPVEIALVKHILNKNGIKNINMVPNNDFNLIASISNNIFDYGFAYYGWDGVLAKEMGKDYKFFYLKDYEKRFDYYSPIIIANDEFLKNNKELTKKVLKAIKKGYIYAIKHPEESAKILIKYAPELAKKEDLIIASQKYLSSAYSSNEDDWGKIDPAKWNAFYEWLNENLNMKIPLNTGFSNEYLKD